MSEIVVHRNAKIRAAIYRMFFEAGDEDYLVARISAKEGLKYQFCWSALQAVEKYLKCALLLNGISVKKFTNHDLLELFNALKVDAQNLIPDMIILPGYFPPHTSILCNYYNEKFENVIDRFSSQGSTHLRYRTYSLSFHWLDLHKFDEIVFYLRRLCVPLDMQLTEQTTYREALLADKSFQPIPQFKFEKIKNSNHIDHIKWRNFSFFEEDALSVGKYCGAYSFTNAPGFHFYQNVANSTEELEWLIDNIKLDKTDRQNLEVMLSDLKKTPHS